MRLAPSSFAALLSLTLLACSEPGAPQPQASLPASAHAPKFSRDAEAPPAEAQAELGAGGGANLAGGGGSADPAGAPDAAADLGDEPADEPGEAPAAPAELPDVEVRNIGMHIGGGPNDGNTKRPVREAVQPHYDALRACYAKAEAPQKEETFGVDILIPRDGGKAKISNPRTALRGDGLSECMVRAFEAVDFPQAVPRRPLMVSFSVQFRQK